MKKQVVLYIAMSLDGYIATKDDNIDFLNIVETPGEDYGYASLLKTVDTIIWGRKTYDKVLSFGIEFPFKDKKVYVLSRSQTGKDQNVEFVNNAEALITELQKTEGLNIYCDGGGEIVFELLKHSLIDTFVISIIPHILGNGKRLFKDEHPEQKLKLKQTITFPSGLVQLWYNKI